MNPVLNVSHYLAGRKKIEPCVGILTAKSCATKSVIAIKDNYKTDITINQYDVRAQLIYSVNLMHAFPIAVNQLDLDWSSDGHHKLAVVFAYTYYDPFNAQIPKSGYTAKISK